MPLYGLNIAIFDTIHRAITNDDAVCVNAAVEINVLAYNVVVRQRMVPGA